MPPIRADLVGVASYGAPQLDVDARLNVNENPFPLPEEIATAMGEAVAAAAVGLNRYPDRDAEALRQALADYIAQESGVRVARDREPPVNFKTVRHCWTSPFRVALR